MFFSKDKKTAEEFSSQEATANEIQQESKPWSQAVPATGWKDPEKAVELLATAALTGENFILRRLPDEIVQNIVQASYTKLAKKPDSMRCTAT